MIKTTLLLSLLTGLFLGVGYMLGGQSGLLIALLFSIVMNIGSYWFSDKIVLSMHRAKKVKKSSMPELYEMTLELAEKANLPMPKLYVYESPTLNAFATGRNYNNSAVAVSTGLMSLLSAQEMRGVIAHELAHIKNRDILTSSIAATIGGALSFMAEMIFGLGSLLFPSEDEGPNPVAGLAIAIVAPIIAMIIQFAISRAREFEADETGAKIAGDSEGLSRALSKLHSSTAQQMSEMDEHQATHMAASHMYIANQFTGNLGKLFSTHPPVEERIARLKTLSL